jgi:hypothetical protein
MQVGTPEMAPWDAYSLRETFDKASSAFIYLVEELLLVGGHGWVLDLWDRTIEDGRKRVMRLVREGYLYHFSLYVRGSCIVMMHGTYRDVAPQTDLLEQKMV